jgi:hypothetical protein
MKFDQAKELLTLISSIDRKPFPEGAAGTWYEILQHVDFGDAKQAIHEHYTSLGARDSQGNARPVLPVDIRSRATAIAEARARAARRTALPSPYIRRGSVGRPPEVEATVESARERIALALQKHREKVAA